jgi:hypothetical protein
MRRILLFLLILIIVGGAFVVISKLKNNDGIENQQSAFRTFFPLGDGREGTNEENNNVDPQDISSNSSTPSSSRFLQITTGPVAGYTVFFQTKGAIIEYFTRYVARQSGFVYEIKDVDGAPQTALRISNVFIPNIYEAVFAEANKTVLLRFLRDDSRTIATYSVPIPDPNPDGTRTQKEGVFFPYNVINLAVSPDNKGVVRLTEEAGSGVITVSSTIDKNRNELLRVPFSEWILSWPTQKSVFVQTKAASVADGFLYSIDTAEKRLKKVIGNTKGLTAAVSPSGTYVLYSESSGATFSTKILNTKTSTIRNLGLSILPEKCAWLKNEELLCAGNTVVEEAAYPDAWYAGIVSFSDNLYRVSPLTNSYEQIDLGENMTFDITNLQIDEARGYLYFINKPTGVLWRFKL